MHSDWRQRWRGERSEQHHVAEFMEKVFHLSADDERCALLFCVKRYNCCYGMPCNWIKNASCCCRVLLLNLWCFFRAWMRDDEGELYEVRLKMKIYSWEIWTKKSCFEENFLWVRTWIFFNFFWMLCLLGSNPDNHKIVQQINNFHDELINCIICKERVTIGVAHHHHPWFSFLHWL